MAARRPFNPDLIAAQPIAPARPSGPITVSQLTALVKQAIESSLPPTVHVLGEISNFKRHSSGHLYLTLKDRTSELSCVMWRSAAESLKFAPADGMEVIATGGVEVFERAGRYQLYIRKLEPRGIGALELAFRQLCERLSREGLFDPRHKKPLPRHPQRIVLVTSPAGAAVADMLRTIERRYPGVHVLIHPVRVQGAGAAEEIAAAIRRVNAQAEALGGVDLMIVGRGGGSLEDLWAFNEEIVARAIHASVVPIISAVGHEVDVTIADFVADVRAATPTAAAELAVPVLAEVAENVEASALRLRRAIRGLAELTAARVAGLMQRAWYRDPVNMARRRELVVDELVGRMGRTLADRTGAVRRRLDRIEPIIRRIAPHAFLLRRAVTLGELADRLRWAVSRRCRDEGRAVAQRQQRLDRASPVHVLARSADRTEGLRRELVSIMCHRITRANGDVERQGDRLSAMSYKSVLGRGFSITRTRKGREVVRSTGELRDRQRLVTELADGEFESEVVNLNQLELFD